MRQPKLEMNVGESPYMYYDRVISLSAKIPSQGRDQFLCQARQLQIIHRIKERSTIRAGVRIWTFERPAVIPNIVDRGHRERFRWGRCAS